MRTSIGLGGLLADALTDAQIWEEQHSQEDDAPRYYPTVPVNTKVNAGARKSSAADHDEERVREKIARGPSLYRPLQAPKVLDLSSLVTKMGTLEGIMEDVDDEDEQEMATNMVVVAVEPEAEAEHLQDGGPTHIAEHRPRRLDDRTRFVPDVARRFQHVFPQGRNFFPRQNLAGRVEEIHLGAAGGFQFLADQVHIYTGKEIRRVPASHLQFVNEETGYGPAPRQTLHDDTSMIITADDEEFLASSRASSPLAEASLRRSMSLANPSAMSKQLGKRSATSWLGLF
eukprot:g14000.t1